MGSNGCAPDLIKLISFQKMADSSENRGRPPTLSGHGFGRSAMFELYKIEAEGDQRLPHRQDAAALKFTKIDI
jgi:hypothetical protein